jgi:hopene-associated glycosyltransferase HpnB
MDLIGAIPVVIWIYLLTARGAFWRVSLRREPLPAPPPRRVVVLIPARNEAALIGAAVTSLARQVFDGFVRLIVIDDGSTDETVGAAAAAADASGAASRFTVIRGAGLPRGWTGKLWALSQGVAAATQFDPDYLLFTDADVCHDPASLAILVATAEAGQRDLVSHMVRLSTARFAERLLIPAFVFFFFMLYPPAWVAAPGRRTAAAAGGCLLIRPRALARIGGLEAIRSRIIDDCALARAVKESGGRVWLGLARDSRSLRSHDSFAGIGAIISRTAFAQLEHSWLLLAATLLALFLAYLLPVVLLFADDGVTRWLGVGALLLMSWCYLPMIRFCELSPLWSVGLPVIAAFYLGAVIHSAVQHAHGRGGRWKGRVQDGAD